MNVLKICREGIEIEDERGKKKKKNDGQCKTQYLLVTCAAHE